MSEIRSIVHDVSKSLAKTNEKLKMLKHKGSKRQITPAFTPVVSEPAGVPSIRYVLLKIFFLLKRQAPFVMLNNR